MTDRTPKGLLSPRSHRARAGLTLGLALGALLANPTPPARAAMIRAHRQHGGSQPILQQDWGRFQDLMKSWETSLAASKPVTFFQGLSVTNPDGTLRGHALARLLRWEKAHRTPQPLPGGALPANVAPLADQQAQVHAQNQAHQVATTIASAPVSAVSSAPRSAGFQVLIPPSDPAAPTTAPNPAAQTMTVPEPSAVVSALAMLGLAGGWWRLRRVRPRFAC